MLRFEPLLVAPRGQRSLLRRRVGQLLHAAVVFLEWCRGGLDVLDGTDGDAHDADGSTNPVVFGVGLEQLPGHRAAGLQAKDVSQRRRRQRRSQPRQ